MVNKNLQLEEVRKRIEYALIDETRQKDLSEWLDTVDDIVTDLLVEVEWRVKANGKTSTADIHMLSWAAGEVSHWINTIRDELKPVEAR